MTDRETQAGSAVEGLRRGVVAVIGRAADECLLVIRRSQHVVAPGAYCFPGGAIESNESEEEALRRELREELQVDVRIRRRVWECVTPWQVQLAWWTAELDPLHAEPQPVPLEVDACMWLAPDEILALPGLLASNVEFLTAVRAGRVLLG